MKVMWSKNNRRTLWDDAGLQPVTRTVLFKLELSIWFLHYSYMEIQLTGSSERRTASVCKMHCYSCCWASDICRLDRTIWRSLGTAHITFIAAALNRVFTYKHQLSPTRAPSPHPTPTAAHSTCAMLGQQTCFIPPYLFSVHFNKKNLNKATTFFRNARKFNQNKYKKDSLLISMLHENLSNL
jgi:hypothetical protein